MPRFQMVDPDTGAPLNAHATLSGCYMAIGTQVITWPVKSGPQHTGSLQAAYVDEAISYAFGLHLLTNAQRGQIYSCVVLGTQQGGVSSVVD